MNTIDAILETYRQGDPQARLDLYLSHRDLRVLFDDIEAERREAGGVLSSASDAAEVPCRGKEVRAIPSVL